MQPYINTALLLIESRTFQLMLNKILTNHQIKSHVTATTNELLSLLGEDTEPDLIFVGKESAIKAGLTPTDFIENLRQNYQGPILLISTDEDIKNIEHYVSSGITDVFSPSEFEQIDNFVANFVSYKSSFLTVSNAKVLLVEDSRSVTAMITKVFGQNNIEVMFVPTGREALTVLHFERVDLVITDYMLEGDMTGLGLIRNIRRTTQWYSLPIMAITAYNDPQRNKELLRNGVSDIMHKPFDVELFLIKCQNLIQNKRTFQSLIDKQQELLDIGQKDKLTGLFNRQYITVETESALKLAKQQSKHVFLIHLDCDDFKQINEQLGYVAADEILQNIAEFLLHKVDKSAFKARLDGDEFMVVLPDSNFETALQIADMIREGVTHNQPTGNKVSVSIGVSGSDGSHSFSEIYIDSDKAIIKAKKEGKNKVILGELMLSELDT